MGKVEKKTNNSKSHLDILTQLEDAASLPDSEIITDEIKENSQSALEQISECIMIKEKNC